MCQFKFLNPKMVFWTCPWYRECPLICPSSYWLDDVQVGVWYILHRTIEVALMAQYETGIVVALSVVPHPSCVLTLLAKWDSIFYWKSFIFKINVLHSVLYETQGEYVWYMYLHNYCTFRLWAQNRATHLYLRCSSWFITIIHSVLFFLDNHV